MSHGKARKENNCLNCNAVVTGRYCSVCGQENIEPKETLWELTSHFVYDLFHYDGKVLSTIKTLVLKPGVLTHEYVRGRRAGYLHPIRLYIFISAVFFIIFISYIVGEKANSENLVHITADKNKVINSTIDHLKDSLTKTNDAEKRKDIQQGIDALEKVTANFKVNDTVNKENTDTTQRATGDSGFISIGNLPTTIEAYNKRQDSLPADKKNGWFTRTVSVKLIALSQKFRENRTEFIKDFTEHFLHSLPTMMFVSLPVIGLIFQLLYVRRRKQFTYVQHGVFTVHIYTAIYIFILIVYGLSLLQNVTHWRLFSFLTGIGVLGIFYYVYRAMRNFYEQGRWKTSLKCLLFLMLNYIVLLLLMLLFFITSLIQV